MNKSITKFSGEEEQFSAGKLEKSIKNAGADKDLARTIVGDVEKRGDISSTKDIHNYTFKFLKEANRPIAGRYNLRRAIDQLGPTGFPFEKFVGEILHHQGYKVTVGQIVKGWSVSHEIDVIAEKDNEHFMIECKFHNEHSIKTNVRVTLYVNARFDDVQRAWKQKSGHNIKFHQPWVVTNTKFTTDAIRYAKSYNMHIVGWAYPHGAGLGEIINELGLHPVTTLTLINQNQKKILIENDVVLCRDVSENINILVSAGLSQSQIDMVVTESKEICELK